MEWADEPGARIAFREALEADRNARLPRSVQGKTLQVFEQEKEARRASAAAGGPIFQHQEQQVTVNTSVAPVFNIIFAEGPQRTGLYVGGAGLALLAGGAVAGSIAAIEYRNERAASTNGDWTAYVRNRDNGKVAADIADGLCSVGALAVGAGAFILWRNTPGIAIGASGGPSVTVGGRF
jgi:hypothetical protein